MPMMLEAIKCEKTYFCKGALKKTEENQKYLQKTVDKPASA